MTRTYAISAVAIMAISGIGIGAGPAAGTGAGHHPRRPASEHVPRSLHRVHLAKRNEPYTHNAKSRTVTGRQAARLVRAFDDLATEPKHYIHCDIAGGPEVIVTFRTAKHTWVVTEAACTNLLVTRDGTSLPTLLADPAWDRAVQHDL